MSNHPNRGGRRKPCVNPTPAEVAKAQERAGLTDARCAELVCVSEVTWGRWLVGAQPMPAGAWKLFRYEIGLLDPPRTAGE